jgi:hypothetical protein
VSRHRGNAPPDRRALQNACTYVTVAGNCSSDNFDGLMKGRAGQFHIGVSCGIEWSRPPSVDHEVATVVARGRCEAQSPQGLLVGAAPDRAKYRLRCCDHRLVGRVDCPGV